MRSKATVLALALAASLAPALSSADVADRLPGITRLKQEVVDSKGPGAYVALRRLWSEWDRGDPAEVEEAVHQLAQGARLSEPARAYAGLLEAYARRRRGDLDGARSRIAQLGYVSQWMIVGPFDNEGKGGFGVAFEPEREHFAPVATTRSYAGKGGKQVRWRVAPPVSSFGWFDTGVFLRPQENVCAYAVTFVRDSRTKTKVAERTISIWAGSAGAVKVFWNGTQVISDEKYRDLDSDRFAAPVTLREGYNRLTVKACGDETAPLVSIRLAGEGGGPDPNLEVDSDPVHSTMQGGATLSRGRGEAAGPAGGRLEGPVQAFERLAKGGDPAVLEAYARYLLVTQSDDPTERRARELASKAAEKAPSIQRLLLAGQLTENRNQRTAWIERAEELVRRGGATEEDQIAVLLARAAHAMAGSNWRDAVPFYERVLARDQDNVMATLARVDLYYKARLHETARAFLSKALDRRPKSVALLRAMAQALREDDLTTEANEVLDRYAQVRFDDPAIARSHVDLAVARRDSAEATRWLDRLIATNPDAQAALHTAAQTYVQLGDRGRAIGTLRRSLELAPDDTDTMKELAAVYALAGQKDDQLKLLRRVLELKPQAKDVREYVALSEPAKPRADEVYARPASEFLAQRGAPAAGRAKRTFVDLQVTTVFPNGLASRFHQVVYQPLTDATAAEGREYAFGYESDSQAVQVRAARVHRADGRVEEASESGEGAVDDVANAVYTTARAYYVRFPRLNPGDVVELQYRVEDVSPRNAFADYFGEVVYMQSSDPIARSEYVLLAPKSRALHFNEPRVPGLKKTVEDRGDQRIYRFLAEGVPAIEPEPNQPPWSELVGHVHVSTYRTWDEMGKWYWGLVKDQFVADDEVKRRVLELTKGLTDERAKVKAVYDFVVQKTRYVALEFGIHGFKPYRCAQIFARGFGDCKDKATLIVTMLKELGIQATIVIVRTQHKGGFEEFPASLAPFDHAIAYVPSLDLYLDGTAEYTGSTELPAMDRGALALQINEGSPKLVHLPDPPASESVTTQKVDLSLTADGDAFIDWGFKVTGVDAAHWRVRFHAEATRKQRVQEEIAHRLAGAELKKLTASNLEDIERPVELQASVHAPRIARKESDGTLVVPVGPREYMVRDFAPMAQRKLDLKLYSQWTLDQEWTIRLPGGAKVKAGIAPASGSGPFGSYKVELTPVAGAVRVKTVIALARTRITPAEYPAFRAWCEEVDRALGQRLVVTLR